MYKYKDGCLTNPKGETVCVFWDQAEEDFKKADIYGPLIAKLLNEHAPKKALKPDANIEPPKERYDCPLCSHLIYCMCE